ncbi:MAG: hypothetical protein JXN59_07940 [Anaerolineae bacterium]|nr:hypothetical protein [Anaerolineae bacterium]
MLREIAQDWRTENRNAPLLEFSRLKTARSAFNVAYCAWNSFQEEYDAYHSPSSELCLSDSQRPSEYRRLPDAPRLPNVSRPLAASLVPAAPLIGQQYGLARPGSLPPLACESAPTWQASAPPDETDSRSSGAGQESRLRRHIEHPEAHYEDDSATPTRYGQPAASALPETSDGTDLQAMRTYRALIRQTSEEDLPALETLGAQIRAARMALGVSRRQLVTLLHLDLELLVALENGCGDVATANLVLEQVTAVLNKRRREIAVQ